MKRVLAICLVLAMALSLAACGGSKGKSPEDVLKETSQNMNKMKSAGFTMTEEIGVKAQGMEMNIKLQADGEVIAEPMAAHMNVGIEAMGMQMKMEMYMQQEGDNVDTYVGMDMGQGMEWGKDTVTVDEAPSMPIEDTTALLAFYTDLKEAGTEKIGDVDTTRYDAKITGKTLKQVLEAMSGMAGDAAGDVDEIFAALPDDVSAPVSFFVDTKNMVLSECRIDMTELIQSVLSDVDLEGGEFTKLAISIGYHDVNKIDKIEIPQEVLGASDM